MHRFEQAMCLVILLFPIVVGADWIDKKGNKVPDSANMKSEEDFVAQLVIIDN